MPEIGTTRSAVSLGSFPKAHSFDHIKKAAAIDSALGTYLKKLSTHDVFHKVYHFEDDLALATGAYWTVSKDTGATNFVTPGTPGIGGTVAGSTGATDNEACSLWGDAIFRGDNHCGMHVHFKLDVVTSFQFEIGFTTAPSDKTLPVVTDIDTPAFGNGGTDAAVVHLDTDQTLKTMSLAAIGSTAGHMATARKSDISTLVPTADTYMCVILFLNGNDVHCIIDQKESYRVALPDQIEGGTSVGPWLFFATRNTTPKVPTVDMIELWGDLA